jgi:hypothetical protein
MNPFKPPTDQIRKKPIAFNHQSSIIEEFTYNNSA